jgi:predicted house-cleaning NTP pyrophosphatase (Maf/HAM1 superfamily)|tara:strand:+ start:54 stop:437 length:384 start_codon:yes stop_codon:yes gene_type:complete
MFLGGKPKNSKQARKQAKQQQKAEKILKRTAVALYDPGSMYERELQKLGVGSRDAATVGRIVDYAYGGLTLGVAPAVKLGADEARSRVAQAKNNNGGSSSGSSSNRSNRDEVLQARAEGRQPRFNFR